MFIQTKTAPRLEIIARWGPLPISMVLRSERNLKSKMLSLARSLKYVNNTSVLSTKKWEEDSYDWKDSPNWIVIVVSNLYSCLLIELLWNKNIYAFWKTKQTEWVSACNWLTVNAMYISLYILVNIERVSKHSVTILGLRMVTPAGLEPG